MDWSHVLAGVVGGTIGSLLTIITERLLFEPRKTWRALRRARRLLWDLVTFRQRLRCPACGSRRQQGTDGWVAGRQIRQGLDRETIIHEEFLCSECNRHWGRDEFYID